MKKAYSAPTIKSFEIRSRRVMQTASNNILPDKECPEDGAQFSLLGSGGSSEGGDGGDDALGKGDGIDIDW